MFFFSEIVDFRIVEYVFCHSMAGLHLKCYEIRPIFRFKTYRSNLIAREVSPKRQRGLLPMTFLLMYTRKKTTRISKTMLACPGPNAAVRLLYPSNCWTDFDRTSFIRLKKMHKSNRNWFHMRILNGGTTITNLLQHTRKCSFSPLL